MLIYFFGLERRFMVDDGSEVEKKAILQEVYRLRNLFIDEDHTRWMLSEFISIGHILLGEKESAEPTLNCRGRELPLFIKMSIGSLVSRGETLPADWLLSWFYSSPDTKVSDIAYSYPHEYRTSFKLKFDQQFPDGLPLYKPTRALTVDYVSGSGEFRMKLEPLIDEKKVPDIANLRKPLQFAEEIAKHVDEDLHHFFTAGMRSSVGGDNLRVQMTLPSELWPVVSTKVLRDFETWVRTTLAKSRFVIVQDLFYKIQGKQFKKVNKRHFSFATTALERIGYSLAPDLRIPVQPLKPEERVFLYELGKPLLLKQHLSQTYENVLFEIVLGCVVGCADGQISKNIKEYLSSKVDLQDLSQLEKKCLTANLEWFCSKPAKVILGRNSWENRIDPKTYDSIRLTLMRIVNLSESNQSKKISLVEKIYQIMQLAPALVYSDLHNVSSGEGLVPVKNATSPPIGEEILQQFSDSGVVLDSQRIANIQSDTMKVSNILGRIFDEDSGHSVEINTAQSVLYGLDEKHTALVQVIITKSHWTENALKQCCSRIGLLMSGAIETINEWAIEAYDEALLEEYEGYEVAAGLVNELEKKFKGALQSDQT